FNSIYDSRVVDHVTNPAADRDVEECSRLVERIAGLSGDDRQLDLPRAIFAFHAGDLHRARRLVARAGRAAQSVAEPYVSAAFLALWRGDFREALRHYTRAASCERFSTPSMIRVVRFLAGVNDAHPERRQLGFGLAFVNDAFVDPATAKHEYEEFLRNTVDEQEEGWALLRDYATRRVTGEQMGSGDQRGSSDESGPPAR
ncbi:MAG: hypothetical protein IMZ71_04190, partial [Chloroflexi bacterium]|nr:hypothetical protein [Chloroflexota bacterium]